MTLNQLQAWLVALQQRAVGLTMLLALIINSVLLGALLYVVLPQYDQTFNEREMMRRVEVLTHATSVDIVNVWQISLVQNRRTYIGSHVLTTTDRPIVDRYVAEARRLTFTQTLAPEVAMSLMNGDTQCSNVFGVTTPNPHTQKFREEIKARQICWVPILSRQGNLIGYAAFIWKQQISQDELSSFMSRSIGLVNQ